MLSSYTFIEAGRWINGKERLVKEQQGVSHCSQLSL